MQKSNTNQTRCRRCGDCCRNGGPALHKADLPLIQDGTIALIDIVTLRPGEWVYDQPLQKVSPLDAEMLKLKGRDGTWTCIYFSPEGSTCGMYETRPVECEVLFCQDIEPLRVMYDKDRLTRADLMPEGHPILSLMADHDEKCAPAAMELLAKAAREGDHAAGESLKEMVVFDMELRRLVPEKTGMTAEMNDFFFGRPLRILLAGMNIKTYEAGGTIRFGFNG
ncbi:YkgJ family cysteine cluster protein [uncultured Pseudodesulfovibrio sp.]|uniref:YkgJ family cysteine cluster protein n=1 Tax=uncultured Pseudodesulfovibrio sp. TaxID=2035858 RepID=UPI0029C74938|nr:YkgJ family cysteine cluster protein [uncultured Pseudodesulfovibrio sp.]